MSGQIKDLKEGNTSIVAKFIKKYTHGDLFKIETVKDYSKNYHECTLEAKEELSKKMKPELKNHRSNIGDYDVIFIGYPNWRGTFPMAVLTFLDKAKLSHKTIIPFCTHEGSGMGSSVIDLKKVCKDCKVLSGKSIKGSQVSSSEFVIIQWIEEIMEEF